MDLIERLTIKIIDSLSSKETSVYLSKGENLLEALVSNKISISSECAGMGRCGKCTIRVMEGKLDITLRDREILSDIDLSNGYRLACMAYPIMDCTIKLISDKNAEFSIVTETISSHKDISTRTDIMDFAIAIDLGTTTLALALVDLTEGKTLENYTAINPQRVYGTDVVSRIKFSNDGRLSVLSQLVRDELRKGILCLLHRQGINFESIKKIVISGNTTMIHLLVGYSCDGLGSYPFTPANLGLINTFTDDLFDLVNRTPVMILPGISVFVGADITAGLLACGIDREDKPCLFIDLGTNGEVAVGNRDKILVTSTAAGPAFEGGNISCGIGSVSGAICHVTFEKGQPSYDTINAQPAVGICGTGVIELVSELLDEGIVNSTGLLMDPHFDEGYEIAGMKFIQKDIRELQMAKAAIRAGVDILVGRFGISYEQIDKVYIAGGFGYHLDIDKAINIGLLPKALVNKTRAVGNTSLSGAIDALIDYDVNARMNHIVSTSEEIHLSNEEDFNDLFVEYMSFD